VDDIGRFRVEVCCARGRYSVSHLPSNTVVVCGLSEERAVQAADTLSIYALKDPSSSRWPIARAQLGEDLCRWAALRGEVVPDFRDFYELLHGKKPTPTPISEAEMQAIRSQHLP
jgi:hypothetical protein